MCENFPWSLLGAYELPPVAPEKPDPVVLEVVVLEHVGFQGGPLE